MAKKRQSHAQKRKAKLNKRARRQGGSRLPPADRRYRTEEWAPLFQATETGILQAWVMTGKQLTDRQVHNALDRMVVLMRGPGLPSFEHACETDYQVGKEEELVIWAVRHGWHHYFDENPHPGTEAMVGILRTLLGSIQVRTTPEPDSRGYLTYIEDFLRQTGVDLHDGAEMSDEEFEELLGEVRGAGEEWVANNDPEAAAFFREMAEKLTASGEAAFVAETCEHLIGLAGGKLCHGELSVLLRQARQALEES